MTSPSSAVIFTGVSCTLDARREAVTEMRSIPSTDAFSAKVGVDMVNALDNATNMADFLKCGLLLIFI